MSWLVIAVRDGEVDTETVYFGFRSFIEAQRFADSCIRAAIKPLVCP